jgi:hypothetical protein
VYYHDTEFQRQRHRERVAEMREDFRRAQPPRYDSQQLERVDAAPVRWIRRQMRRRSARRAPAY